MAVSTEHRMFALHTPLGTDEFLLRDMTGRESLSRLFEFDLKLISDRDDIQPEDVIGKRSTLRVETFDGEQRYFTGFMSRFTRIGATPAPEGMEGEYYAYECDLVPWLWFMLQHEDSRIFQDKTIPEIVEAVFAEFDYSDYELKLSGEHPPLTYCVQYRETNFAFVSRLLERAGIHYFFRHEPQAEKLILTDNRDHNPKLEPDTLPFHDLAMAEASDSITALKRRERLHTGRVVLRDYDFERPSADLEVSVDSLVKIGDNGNYERFVHPDGYTEREHGDALARVRMEAEEADQELLDGASDVRTLVPGHVFTLERHPEDALNEDYLIVSVEHRGRNNLGSGRDSGYDNRFTVIPHRVQYRAPLTTPRARVHGPQTAVVSGPAGEEIHTDKYGRVKVKFRWDRTQEANDKSSCWLRVAQMWAGKQWGAMFIPRMGMEVLVDFLEGDPDQPIVVGCLYNGENMPPYGLPELSTVSALKTNSSKDARGFNELRFEDRAGGEQLMMHAQRRMDVCVGTTFCERNGGTRNLRVGRDFNRLTGRDVNSIVKQGWYQDIGKDRDLTVRGNVHHDFQADLIEKVAGLVEVNSNTWSLVAADEVNVKSSVLFAEVAADLKVRGGTIVLEGSTGGITLKCGASFITLQPDGISIVGPLVRINSGGAARDGAAAMPAGPLVMEEPFEPYGCRCGTPGLRTGTGKGGSRRRRSKTVEPNNPPDWKPPKPIRPERPEPPVPVVPCDIAALKVTCEHKVGHMLRTASGGRLQVVANTQVSHTLSFNPPLGDSIKFSISAKVGDADTVGIDVELADEGNCKQKKKQWAVTRDAPPAESEWRSDLPGKHKVADKPLTTSLQVPPSAEKPDFHYVYGRGATSRIEQVRVEVFPARQCEASLEFEAEWINKIGRAIRKVLTAADLFLPVGLKFDIKPPKGKATLKWGWTEYTDWQAFFAFEVHAAFDPLLDVTASFRADGTKLVKRIPLIGRYAKHVAEAYIQIDVKGKIALVGNTRVAAPRQTADAIEPQGRIGVEATAAARLGSTSLAYAEIKGGGKSGISLVGTIKWQEPNLWFEPKLKFDGLKVELKLVLRTYIWDPEYTGALDVLDESTIWESKYKLLGPE